MFSISNEIAYDGLMVHAAGNSPSPIAEALSPFLPKSCWLDVFSSSEKWSQAEGRTVVELLRRLASGGVVKPSLYLISPFREVADRLRSFVIKSGVLSELGIPIKQHRDWGDKNIGTVHTFQGKEAEAVVLVLGASADSRKGARTWAGGTPNILNVAATRAKQALYVVGRHDVWSSAGVFSYAAKILPVVTDPFSQTDLGNPAVDAQEAETDESGRDPAFDDAELTEEF